MTAAGPEPHAVREVLLATKLVLLATKTREKEKTCPPTGHLVVIFSRRPG
jgi:hypothetical protein